MVRYTCPFCHQKKVVGSLDKGFICVKCDIKIWTTPIDYWQNLKDDEKAVEKLKEEKGQSSLKIKKGYPEPPEHLKPHSTQAFNDMWWQIYYQTWDKWRKNGFSCYKTHQPKHTEKEAVICACESAKRLAGYIRWRR